MAKKDDEEGPPTFLRAWRKHRDLTQGELASLVGTNQNMIGYLEKGERTVSVEWLRKIAPALKTTPGMLIDGDPAILDLDIIQMLANAPIAKQRQIAEIIRTILKDDEPE